jgi:hypothetical protein
MNLILITYFNIIRITLSLYINNMINLNKIFELSFNHMIKYCSYTFILFNMHNCIYVQLLFFFFLTYPYKRGEGAGFELVTFALLGVVLAD